MYISTSIFTPSFCLSHFSWWLCEKAGLWCSGVRFVQLTVNSWETLIPQAHLGQILTLSFSLHLKHGDLTSSWGGRGVVGSDAWDFPLIPAPSGTQGGSRGQGSQPQTLQWRVLTLEGHRAGREGHKSQGGFSNTMPDVSLEGNNPEKRNWGLKKVVCGVKELCIPQGKCRQATYKRKRFI